MNKLSTSEKIELVRKDNCSISILEEYLNDDNWEVRFTAAKNPNLSKERLSELSKSPCIYITRGVALNINTSKTIIKFFLKRQNLNMHIYAAQHQSLSKKDLRKLANSKQFNIRRGVSLNKNTDQETLEILLKDHCSAIKYNAAKHSNLSKNKLKQLIDLNSFPIMEGILLNENCDEEILNILLKNNNKFIARNAAKNSKLSKERLKELIFSDDINIKLGVVENKKADEEILKILSKDKNDYLKLKIISNNNTPAFILKDLYTQYPYEVIRHPNCPDYLKAYSK